MSLWHKFIYFFFFFEHTLYNRSYIHMAEYLYQLTDVICTYFKYLKDLVHAYLNIHTYISTHTHLNMYHTAIDHVHVNRNM